MDRVLDNLSLEQIFQFRARIGKRHNQIRSDCERFFFCQAGGNVQHNLNLVLTRQFSIYFLHPQGVWQRRAVIFTNMLIACRNKLFRWQIIHNVILCVDKQLPWWLSGKEYTCNAGAVGLIPGLARSPGGGRGSPLQYSCWRIPWTEDRRV